jgi:hypothetical protein
MAVAGEDALVTIASVYSRSELLALVGLLRAHRLFVSTIGEGHGRVDWAIMLALGGVRVQVRAKDVPLARDLLLGVERSVYRGPVYGIPRAVDIALMLLCLFPFGVPPPARLPADFYFAGPRSAE